ncbi:MAG: hypothetical protein ACLUDG_10910 [Butyricicoccus sp.]
MKFTLDGTEYDVFVTSLKRDADIKDGKNSSTTLSGRYRRDVVGTFYNYDMDIGTNRTDPEQYDRLYEVLTSPQNQPHTITLPYGQSTITFTAYIKSVSDTMPLKKDGRTAWTELSVKFEAEKPQRRPT